MLFTLLRTTVAATAAYLVMAAVALAQVGWPSQPIKLIVPFPAGNTADIVARILSDGLSRRLGQPIVVDNRAGASGIIGADAVAKAQDQHTLLLTTSSPLVINPGIYRQLPYNVDRDFKPIIKFGSIPMMLIGRNDLTANTVIELVTYLKANPGKFDYASVGPSTFAHLTMELFRRQTAIDVLHVPFRGASAAHTELIAGRIALMFDSIASANQQVRAGSVKAFAITSLKRSPFAPDVPTIAEFSIPGQDGFEVEGWIGVLAPRGMPAEIVQRIETAIRAELADATVVARLEKQSISVGPSSTALEFLALLQREKEKWSAVAKDARLEPL